MLLPPPTLIIFMGFFVIWQALKKGLDIAVITNKGTCLFGSAGRGSDQKYSSSRASEAVIRSRGLRVNNLSKRLYVSFPSLIKDPELGCRVLRYTEK